MTINEWMDLAGGRTGSISDYLKRVASGQSSSEAIADMAAWVALHSIDDGGEAFDAEDVATWIRNALINAGIEIAS